MSDFLSNGSEDSIDSGYSADDPQVIVPKKLESIETLEFSALALQLPRTCSIVGQLSLKTLVWHTPEDSSTMFVDTSTITKPTLLITLVRNGERL